MEAVRVLVEAAAVGGNDSVPRKSHHMRHEKLSESVRCRLVSLYFIASTSSFLLYSRFHWVPGTSTRSTNRMQ